MENSCELKLRNNDTRLAKIADVCNDCAKEKGIFELLIMTGKIRELVFEKVASSVLKEKAKELGMVTLRDDGIKKILNGMTTISEVMRVTQQDVA